MPAAYLDDSQTRTVYPDREVDSLCPYCGVGCQVSYKVKDDKIVYAEGRDGPANHNRLCVKGRFGFDYVHHPHRLTKPLIRLDNVAKDANDQVDPGQSLDPLPRGDLGGGAGARRRRPQARSATRTAAGAGGLRLGQGLERGGLPLPEARAPRLRLEQRRPLHPALPRLVGGGPDGGPQFRRRHGAVLGRPRRRGHRHHRRQPDGEPPGGRDLHQERGQGARRQADRHGSAPAGPVAPRPPAPRLQARHATWPC